MMPSRILLMTAFVVSATLSMSPNAMAQRIYYGSTSSDLQYPRSRGLDSNGRVTDVDGRSIDQYGFYTDDYGRQAQSYGVPGHYHGAGYASGGYMPGSYSGLGTSNSLGYSVGLSGYSGGFASNSRQVMSSNVVGAYPISPPRSIIVGGVYPSRTVMNNATRGGVMESTHNGNGYIYSPGSSYQTVISSGPSIFPSTTVIQPSQPPVIIEARKSDSATVAGPAGAGKTGREIQLMFPKSANGSLSYMLNGTVYSIKPGYVQTFTDDRIWTIEFLRSGNRSQVMKYQLTAGTYIFDADEFGWDLKQAPVVTATQPSLPPPLPLPPPPVPAPVPSPDL